MLTGIALALVWTGPVAIATDSISRSDVVLDLHELRALVATEFAYTEDKTARSALDLDRLLASAEAELPETPTRNDALRAITLFVAGLEDGHAFASLGDESLWPRFTLPIELADTREDGVAVRALPPGVDVDVRPGDVVLAIDGEPIETRIARITRLAFASTDGQRRATALRHAGRVERNEARLSIKRGADAVREVAIRCDVPKVDDATAKERVSTRRFDDDIALLTVHTFQCSDPPAWKNADPAQRDDVLAADREELRAAFRSIAGARGLILDLRGNGGGTDLLGQELTSHLLASPYVYFDLQGKHLGAWLPHSPIEVTAPPDLATCRAPLVVLIDSGCFSVTDNVCAALRDLHPHVTFIGQPTGGGTGAPRSFTLTRTGARVTFCTMRVRSPSGELIEGRGTRPRVLVTPTADDLAHGRDPALDAALALLRE